MLALRAPQIHGPSLWASVLVFLLYLPGCTGLRVLTHETTTDVAALPAETYRLDTAHAHLGFRVSHLGFARYVGRFNSFDGTLAFVPAEPERSRVDIVIKTASVDTNNPTLEGMMRGEALFASDRHPEARFVSTRIIRTGETSGRMTGDLTLRGVTRPVELEIHFYGAAPNPLTRAPTLGFRGTGAFKRSDFGLTAWAPAVGDEVVLDIEVEFMAPAP